MKLFRLILAAGLAVLLLGQIFFPIQTAISYHAAEPTAGSSAPDNQPVVRAVMFWLDGCGHCHDVIENVLPPLQEKYGAALQIQLIELKGTEDTNHLYDVAAELKIPKEKVGVPFLIIGKKALIGSVQIPQELPGLIEKYLADGGIDYPPLATLAKDLPATPVPTPAQPETSSTARALYFYSRDCSHCLTTLEEVIAPLQAQYGSQLDIRQVEISTSQTYELLIHAEELYKVTAEQRSIPTLVIGSQILIGEDQIRANLPDLIEKALSAGGTTWPDLTGLQEYLQTPSTPQSGPGLPGSAIGPGSTPNSGLCGVNDTSGCDTQAPIWGAYFYQVGCKQCSRAKLDIDYIRQQYPQFVIEEFNIYDHTPLAEWMAERAGQQNVSAPSLFIGDRAMIGEAEITPENIKAAIQTYQSAGSPKFWNDFVPTDTNLIERFRSFGPLTVAFAGLIDGLNPCAFATLIFFVSYLTLSGRKGREIIAVGGAFTIGVFLAYLAVGLGFYKVLDLLGNLLTTISRWVYALTALLCAALAVFSFLDYLKARKGQISDMALKLPEPLRLRINQTIRAGRKQRAYVIGALITGVLISFLELACTGQIYLPTIIFVSSIPSLRGQAILFLLLYNLLFIIPLIVVFILAYYGTTSHDLTQFLQRNAARVKLGMVVLFATLAIWLGISLL